MSVYIVKKFSDDDDEYCNVCAFTTYEKAEKWIEGKQYYVFGWWGEVPVYIIEEQELIE